MAAPSRSKIERAGSRGAIFSQAGLSGGMLLVVLREDLGTKVGHAAISFGLVLTLLCGHSHLHVP